MAQVEGEGGEEQLLSRLSLVAGDEGGVLEVTASSGPSCDGVWECAELEDVELEFDGEWGNGI